MLASAECQHIFSLSDVLNSHTCIESVSASYLLRRMMAGRFVRSSKYRGSSSSLVHMLFTDNLQGHVFGRPTRKEQCYDNLRISKNAWDTNLIKVWIHSGS